MVDLSQHQAGINAAMNAIVHECQDPRSAFLDHLSSFGYSIPYQLLIGKIDRINGDGEKGNKKSAWYIYDELDDSQNAGAIIGVASFGDWRLPDSNQSWTSRTEHKMSASERVSYQVAREKMREQRELELKTRNEEAAQKALYIWQNNEQATSHPYLEKKQVNAAMGVKVSKQDGRLIIPIAINGIISNVQFIDDDGSKRFLKGGKKKGGWYSVYGASDTIYICEGYSTALSVHQATGATVYVAFDAGNLYEVTAYVKKTHDKARIIIAGDDDFEGEVNTGRKKAEQAAQGLNVECIFPDGVVDFNDMHVASGLESVASLLSNPIIDAYVKPVANNGDEDDCINPIGVLGDIVNYYNATSGNVQSGFAIQTALTVCATVLSRCYKTNLDNHPNLYLLNVGKSGTGKEHAKTVTEKIMNNSGVSHLIAGDGYTSGGAVFSTLLQKPSHVSCIDEFGRYLEAGRDNGKGNTHQREANTKLMEAFGRGSGVMRPPSYSTMTLKKDDAKALSNRLVYNPAINLLSMTTPDTLFRTLDMGAVKDGFINRFIISISDAEREKRKHKNPIDVPTDITQWIDNVISRHGGIQTATEPAEQITLDFSIDADNLQDMFQDYCINMCNKLEQFGMSELPARSNEIAMKLSLIHALSRDYNATVILEEDMAWAISYVKSNLNKTVNRLKLTISHSEFESDKKEILQALRDASSTGVTKSSMNKKSPFSKHRSLYLKEILECLKDGELADFQVYKSPKNGRSSVKWIALK